MKAKLTRLLVASLSVVTIGCTPAAPQPPVQPTPPAPQPTGGLPSGQEAVATPGKQPTATGGSLKSDADIEAKLKQLDDEGSSVDEPAASDDDLDSF